MQIKEGVIVQGVRPELLIGLMVANDVYRDYGQDLVVTSLLDSKHSQTSLHYSGCAADMRTRYFKDREQVEEVAAEIRTRLGNSPDYDVVVESNHIHMEYQPKYRG